MAGLLITGGAGFIGCNLVRRVLATGDEPVTVLDKLTYAGHRENLADLLDDPRLLFHRGDIADGATVGRLLDGQRPRAVIHCAAETHVDRSIDSARPFVATNIVGGFELLEAARRFWERQDGEARERFRFVQVSTDEVYGSLEDDGAFVETTPFAPNSPYAASKASADHLARAFWRTYGMPVVVTHCSNNFGPYQFPEKLIPLMILNALEARDLPVYGDGGNVRDWLYVEDHCDGLLAALERGRPGERYNFGGADERTNLELVRELCRRIESIRPAADNPAMRRRGLSDYAGLITFVEDRKGHDRRYAVDPARARRELGWQPASRPEAALDATVRWYLEHRDWCESVQRNADYRRERLGQGETT